MTKENITIQLLGQFEELFKLVKGLEKADKTTKNITANMRRMEQMATKIGKSYREMDSRIAAGAERHGFTSTNQLSKGLRSGGPEALLLNSTMTGQLNQFSATMEQLFTRFNNTMMRGMNGMVRAVENNRIRQMVEGGVGQTSGNLNTLQEQIQAQKIRVANAELQRAEILMDKRKTAQARESLTVLQREQATLAELQAAKQNILNTTKQQERVERKVATLTERIAQNAAIGRSLRGVQALDVNESIQNRAARVQNLVARQQLVVERERVQANGVLTEKLKHQQTRLERLLNIQKGIRRETQGQLASQERINMAVKNNTMAMRTRTNSEEYQQSIRDFRVESLTGDGGASLFKIQGQLLVNYTLMDQMFNLFNFGRTFVIELDKAFQDLQAITATTDTEMTGLKDALIGVSEQTKFTAVEVAQAAIVMGQAGFSTTQIKQGIESVTLFATAVGSDLQTAVDLTTSVLSVFNLRAEETNRVANVLTGAINNSKLTVDKLTLGLQYAGNAAAQSGATLEELTSVLGALANSGIRSGSTLGTGLRQVLVSFQDPSKKFIAELANIGLTIDDVDVKSKGLVGVFRTLNQAGFSSAQAFKSFETRAAAAYIAVANNLDVADALQNQLMFTNAAAEANEKQMKSLANTMDRFRSILGTVIVNGAEPLKQAFILATNVLGGFLRILNDLGPVLPLLTTALLSFGIAVAAIKVKALVAGLGAGKTMMTAFAASATGATVATTGLRVAITTLMATPLFRTTGIVFVAIASIAALRGSFDGLKKELDRARAALDDSVGAFETTEGKILSLDKELERLTNRYNLLKNDSNAFRSEVYQLQEAFGLYNQELASGTLKTVDELIDAVSKLRTEFRLLAKQQAESVTLSRSSLLRREADFLRSGEARINRGVLGVSSIPDTTWADISTSSAAERRLGLNEGSISQAFHAKNSLENIREDFADFIGSLDITAMTTEELRETTDRITKDFKARSLTQRSNLDKTQTLLRELLKDGDLGFSDRKTIENLKEKVSLYQEQSETILGARMNNILSELQSQITTAIDVTENGIKGLELYTLMEAKLQRMYTEIEKQKELLAETDDPAERAAIQQEIDRLSKVLKDFVKERISNETSNFRQLLQAMAQTRGLEDGIQAAIADMEQQANSKVSETETYIKRNVTTQSEYFDKMAEMSAVAYEKLKDATDRAIADAERKASYYDQVLRETGEGGSLFGRFSDAERSMIRDRQRDAEINVLRVTRDQTQRLLPGADAEVAAAQRALDHASKYKDSKNAQEARQYISALKALNEAQQKRVDIETELLEIQQELDIKTGDIKDKNEDLATEIDHVLEKYKERLEVESDLGQSIEENLTKALDNARSSMKNWVTEVAKGTQSVGDSFRQMGVSILESMLDVVSSQVADQFMMILLGGKDKGSTGLLGSIGSAFAEAFGGSGRAVAGNIDFVSAPSLAPVAMNQGGFVKANMGRAILGRDSVPILGEHGEYVLRKSAVDMIGRNNLDQLNAMGNARVSQTRVPSIGAQGKDSSPKVTNVWVVSPDQKPSLTKNDVLVTVTEDMAKGGSTKKLVKQIIQGG